MVSKEQVLSLVSISDVPRQLLKDLADCQTIVQSHVSLSGSRSGLCRDSLAIRHTEQGVHVILGVGGLVTPIAPDRIVWVAFTLDEVPLL